MENESSPQIPAEMNTWSADLEAFFNELRQRTILMMLPALVGCAVLMGVSLSPTTSLEDSGKRLLTALLMIALAGAVFAMRQWSFPAAAWLFSVGSLALNMSVATWKEMDVSIFLLAVSVGLATLLISRTAGGIIALACSLLVWFTPAWLLPASPMLRSMTILGIWGVYGLLVVALFPLIGATSWAWSGYQRSLLLVKQAQEYQQQIHDTLEDLTDANAQLVRINQYAQGLRLLAEEERRIKEQFVANVSHELRTPLNMIIGFSEMILQAPENYSWDLSPKLLADLDVIQRNSQHLSELVDDVLDLSQIEAGRMALTREHVSLGEIVEAATVAVRPLFETKHLALVVDLPADLPTIFCDRTRIREVILNLLSNAGRFTEVGGVTITARQDGRNVVVSVQDTGPGILPEDQARLFQPFQQLDNTLRRRHRGTGLGLSLSKSFVELHDGKMWLESKKGQGTSVFFRLPVEPFVPIIAGPAAMLIPGWEYLQRTRRPQAQLAPIKPKVMVVEEGQSLKALLTRHLNGIEVVAAADLPQAVRDLHTTPAQALLINQPVVSAGLQTVIDTAVLPLGVPVMICTVPNAEDAANQMGANDYLVKPIAREALLAALERLGPGIKTVLVADDDPDALQLFRRMLVGAGSGYRVLRAVDGYQAVEIMRSEKVDVVLLDLMMPEMNGYQVLAERSQDAALSAIPVILISARDPWGQPIVSKSLAVTCRDGLSVQELLMCIESISAILSKTKPPVDPAPPAALSA